MTEAGLVIRGKCDQDNTTLLHISPNRWHLFSNTGDALQHLNFSLNFIAGAVWYHGCNPRPKRPDMAICQQIYCDLSLYPT